MFTRSGTNTGSQFPRKGVGAWRIRLRRKERRYESQTLCRYPRLLSVLGIGIVDQLQQFEFEFEPTTSNCDDCSDERVWSTCDGQHTVRSAASCIRNHWRKSDGWRYCDIYGSSIRSQWHVLRRSSHGD